MGMMDLNKLNSATDEMAKYVVSQEPSLLQDEHYRAEYLDAPVSAVWRAKIRAAQIAKLAEPRAMVEDKTPPLQRLYDDAKSAGHAALKEALEGSEPMLSPEQPVEIPDDPSSLFNPSGQA